MALSEIVKYFDKQNGSKMPIQTLKIHSQHDLLLML